MCLSVRKAFGVLAAMIAAFLICPSISAQLNTGRISGAVTDQSGGVIAGAKVTVIDVARGVNRDLVADEAGQYAAPNLNPGIYTVSVESMGFQTLQRENVDVVAGSDVRVDVTLKPGEQGQTVTVNEALPIINTTNAQTGGVLDNQQLSNLPINGRDFRWEYNLTTPGLMVAVGEGVGTENVNGTPNASMYNFIYDGIYSGTLNQYMPLAGGTSSGGDTTIMPLDAIQEATIVLNAKAEYGWAPGMTFNAALKSGTNTMHGGAYAYGRDTSFDAKNPFASQTTPVQFEQFGANFGGPIKKDKIFYFAAYEGDRVSTAANYTTSVPTEESLASSGTPAGSPTSSIPDAIAGINSYILANPTTSVALSQLSLNLSGCNISNPNIHSTVAATVATACGPASGAPTDLWNNFQNSTAQRAFAIPQNGSTDNGVIKMDYHVNDHHSINGSLYIGRYAEGVVPQGSGVFTQTYYEELIAVQSDMARLVEIWTPNSSWLNEARIGVDYSNWPVYREECVSPGASSSGIGVPAGNDGGPNYLTAYGLASGAAGCGIPTLKISGFTGQLGFGNNRVDWEDPISGADSLSYTRGSHQFKFGTDIRNMDDDAGQFADSVTGSVSFGSSGFAAFPLTANNPAATPLQDFLAGEPASESVRPTTPVRHLKQDWIAFFAQDDWRVIPRLTLNLGLRWEGLTPLTTTSGQAGNFAPGTPTGMIQNNQVFPFLSEWEPRGGLAYDLTGHGTTVLRAGGGIMYMVPLGANYVGAGTSGSSVDYGSEATGSTLYYANGTAINTPGNQVGNITSAVITPTAITKGGVINLPSNLPWGISTATSGAGYNPIFPTLTPQCGDGQPINGIGTTVSASNPINPATCYGQGGNPNLKQFPMASWNLDVEHAFTNNLSLYVGYAGSRIWNYLNTLNINQPYAGISGTTNATVGGVTYAGEFLREPYNIANGTAIGTQCVAGETSCYPWFSNIIYDVNGGGANYAGLQMNLTAKNIHGLTLSVNYTLSHSMVQTMVQGLSTLLNGNNSLDVRNHFATTFSYALPGKKVPGQMLSGWALNGSANLLTHLPVNLTDTTDDLMGWGASVGDPWNLYGSATAFNRQLGGAAGNMTCYGVAGSKFASNGCITVPDGTGTIGTPTYVANLPAACLAGAATDSISNGGLWNVASNSSVPVSTSYGYNGYAQMAKLGCYMTDGSALTPPAQGTYGNLYPYQLRGKGDGLLSLSVTKDWKFKERLDTQFRFEVFNVLNRTQYSGVGSNLGSPTTVGVATSTPDVQHGNAVVGSGGPREAQVALKFLW